MSLYSYAKVSRLSHATYTVGLKNCLLALYVMQRLAIASFVSPRLPLFRLARKVRISCYSCILNWMQLDYYAHICSDKKKDRCGMYPKKTLSAASLLSECERKRCRSLEARGCAKSESEFSMGTAATCPFIMSEQNPRNIKLHHQYMHEVTSKHYDKLKFIL